MFSIIYKYIFCSFSVLFFQPNSHISIFFEKKKNGLSPLNLPRSRKSQPGGKLRVLCVCVLSLGDDFFLVFESFFCFLPLIFTLRDKCVRVLAKLTINLYLIQCFNFCSYFTHLLSTFSPARLLVFLFVKFIQFQVLSLARLPLNNFLLVFVVSLTSHAHHRAKRLSTLLSSLFCRHS